MNEYNKDSSSRPKRVPSPEGYEEDPNSNDSPRDNQNLDLKL